MDKSVCKNNIALREVLVAVNAEPAGIAFLTDGDGELKGVITDGDFRRLLLAGKSLDDKLEETDYGDFVFAKQGDDVQELIARTSRTVRIIPIVDEGNKPVDYFRYEHKTHFTPVAEPSLSSKELEYLTDAFLSTWISSRGMYIDRFESEFSSYCGCEYGVATSNGTVAIHLALDALGIKAGDEVIVPDLTFAATINAVLYTGATPVIVDIDPDRWTISPQAIEEAITPQTKAIIPVHIYGQPCEMDKVMAIAEKHNLFVVEDCAEAHGASYQGRKVGSFGHISTFSFFANKIITTGEGGMCVTNSSEFDERMRVLRDHGMSKEKKYWHDVVGYNYRMTNLQAAIGCAQLERIDEIIAEHRAIEEAYKKSVQPGVLTWQSDFSDSERVVWLVCALSNDRDSIISELTKNNIEVRPFFYCLSDMPVYAKYARECVNSKSISARGLNLPTVKTVNYERLSGIL